MSLQVLTTVLLAASEAPDPSGPSAATSVVVAALGGAGLSAIFAAIVTGLFSKRKLGAEATEIITKAAAGVVTNIQGELDRQVSANALLAFRHDEEMLDCKLRMDAMSESHAEELEEVRRVLQLHVAWDAIAISELAKLGVSLPPAPPLLPARRFDHKR